MTVDEQYHLRCYKIVWWKWSKCSLETN